MGAANVVPGVSGGTIAVIVGIYERLIDALKGLDVKALKLLLKFRISEFVKKTDLVFLISIAFGALLSILTLAKVLKWGMAEHPRYVWALFFGLILASVPMVGKTVKKWNTGVWVYALMGCAIAAAMAFLSPANENDHPLYLLLCGVVAMCSMIIPGLSGSFVLILLGNYVLIMVDSVNALRSFELGKALPILIPVSIGAVVGMLTLSRFLSWLFKRFHDYAMGLITGFIAGSLLIIWPWKEKGEIMKLEGKEKVLSWDYGFPALAETETWIAVFYLILGIALMIGTERFGKISRLG